MAAKLLRLGVLLFLVVFLVYPIAYIFPRSVREVVPPYRVILLSVGKDPEKVRRELHGATVPAPGNAMADGLSAAEATALERRLAAAGAKTSSEGTHRTTLYYLRSIYTNPFLSECLLNSLTLAAGVLVLTTLITLPLAHWFTRFHFPAKPLLSGLLLIPLVLPPFVGAIGFRQLFARFGTVNLLLMDWGLTTGPIDWLGAGGLWAVVVVEVLHLYPIMYLNVTAAMANVDPSLEDAARSLGSSEWTVFRRVTFPLMLPGYFAGGTIVFIWAFTDLGTPLVFGFRRVLPLQIFEKINDAQTNPMGYALVVMTLVLTAALYFATRWAVSRRPYAMLSKGGTAAQARPAGPARTAVVLVATALVVALALVPHLGVVLTSLAKRWSFTPLPSEWTTDYYELALTHRLAGLSIRNSLLYSLLSASLDVVLGVTIAYLVSRRPGRLGGLLDALSVLPLALPGLVLAFGYLTCFNFQGTAESLSAAGWPQLATAVDAASRYFNPLEFPVLLLILAYTVRRLPFMTRAALAGFQQTSVAYEEAAANLGASPFRVLRKIALPLVSANVLAGAILAFAFAMLEVSDSLMLAQKQSYFPITKAIAILLLRPDDGPYIASALGVLGMLLLMASLLTVSAVLGKRMGELFR